MQPELFSTVPDDFLGIFGDSAKPDAKRITHLLDYSRKDVAAATEVPYPKVRLEPNRIPKELVERLAEWGVALNLVAQFFRDEKKTVLWFRTPNPMLGNVAPRDMIRMGRFKKLLRFIQTAMDEERA